MLDTLNVPREDRFQIITEHPRTSLIDSRDYLDIRRSDDCIFLQITTECGPVC